MSPQELPPQIAFGDAARLQLPAYAKTCRAMLPATLKGDVEALHDLRVASRRLRAALAVYATAFPPKLGQSLQREAKSLTSALGPVRDLDVQIQGIQADTRALPDEQRGGLTRVLRQLKRQRRQARRVMRTKLRSWSGNRLNRLLDEALVALLPTEPLGEDTAPLRAAWKKVVDQSRDVADPAKVEELHQMRIETKRLRYTLELFAPTLPAKTRAALKPLTEIQEHLGQIHDLDVRLPLLTRGVRREKHRKNAAAGLAQVIAQTVEERSRLYREFLVLWEQHRSELTVLE